MKRINAWLKNHDKNNVQRSREKFIFYEFERKNYNFEFKTEDKYRYDQTIYNLLKRIKNKLQMKEN